MLTPYPKALLEMMELLKTLPGIGKRSAERMALAILKWDNSKLGALSENLRTLRERVGICSVCGNLADGSGKNALCSFCASPARDHTSLCVVEDPSQIRAVEAGGVFHGLYHVLGGRIAPLEGKSAEDLSIATLEQRIAQGSFREVILALSPDVEGQATCVYLANRLKNKDLRISKLARGLPAGSDLAYADPATIAAALSGRTGFDT